MYRVAILQLLIGKGNKEQPAITLQSRTLVFSVLLRTMDGGVRKACVYLTVAV
jgi:hypothetical protein